VRTLIVIESCFGNTRAVAEAVALGLQDGGAEVERRTAGEAPITPAADLVVVAAPTHNLGLPTPASRGQARGVVAAPVAAPVPETGVREWLERATADAAARLITIDTVVKGSFSGSAANAARKLARRRGWRAERGPSFVVAGREGPLAEGELDRARAFGRGLAV
jgi:flavorubredoxin